MPNKALGILGLEEMLTYLHSCDETFPAAQDMG